jgi:hypothetical protein
LDFCVTQGVIVVSVRTVGNGEKCRGDASSLVNEESRRSLDRLIGVEKLVLIVKGWDNERDFRFVSLAVYQYKSINENFCFNVKIFAQTVLLLL